jgi:hypothetical protein
MVLTSTLILAQRVETTGIMFNYILCISIFVLGTQVSHMLEMLVRMGLKKKLVNQIYFTLLYFSQTIQNRTPI